MSILELLIDCYYEKMTVDQAVEFIKRCYQETPTEDQIKRAKRFVKNIVDEEWE